MIPGPVATCRISSRGATTGPGIRCGCILYIGLIGCIVKTGQHSWSSLDINPPGSSRGQATSRKLAESRKPVVGGKLQAASLTSYE